MPNYRYYIYCHTNKINGKKYIGRTHINPIYRWRKGGEGYRQHRAFYSDIQEYGWENFTHEILEYGIVGRENADEAEKKYIKELNTVCPNGYNIEDGGTHGSVNPHEKKDKRPLRGWHHSEETRKKIGEGNKRANKHESRPYRCRPVDMYTKDGRYIRTFYGAAEASRETGIDITMISNVCKCKNGRYKTAGGYRWKYSTQKGERYGLVLC